MAINRNLGAFILIATLVAQAAWVVRAKEHIVGDDAGWNLGVDYVAWANGREFNPGDTLVFNYDKTQFHVFHVTKERYETCCPLGAIMELPCEGRNVVTLGTGEYAFIAKRVDCVQGLKLLVSTWRCPHLEDGKPIVLP